MPIVLLLVAAIIGTGSVSTQAKPSDALFPVKLVLENVQEAVTIDPKARATLQAQHALERLQEVQTQIASGNAKGLTVAISNLEQQVKGAADSVKSSGDAATAQKIQNDLTDIENEIGSLSGTNSIEGALLQDTKDLVGIEKSRVESVASPDKAKTLLQDALNKAETEASASAKEVEQSVGSTEDKQALQEHENIVNDTTHEIETESNTASSSAHPSDSGD